MGCPGGTFIHVLGVNLVVVLKSPTCFDFCILFFQTIVNPRQRKCKREFVSYRHEIFSHNLSTFGHPITSCSEQYNSICIPAILVEISLATVFGTIGRNVLDIFYSSKTRNRFTWTPFNQWQQFKENEA